MKQKPQKYLEIFCLTTLIPSRPKTHVKKAKKVTDNTYGIVMFLILTNTIMGIIYLILIYAQNHMLKAFIFKLVEMNARFSRHVVPVAWILTHNQIRKFVSKKFIKMRNYADSNEEICTCFTNTSNPGE